MVIKLAQLCVCACACLELKAVFCVLLCVCCGHAYLVFADLEKKILMMGCYNRIPVHYYY